jgi:hypothetical protein
MEVLYARPIGMFRDFVVKIGEATIRSMGGGSEPHPIMQLVTNKPSGATIWHPEYFAQLLTMGPYDWVDVSKDESVAAQVEEILKTDEREEHAPEVGQRSFPELIDRLL